MSHNSNALTVNPDAIDDAILDFRSIIDSVSSPTDAELKKKLEDVYARVFYSVYYVNNNDDKNNKSGDGEDDQQLTAYAVLLREREELWLREKNRLTEEVETLKRKKRMENSNNGGSSSSTSTDAKLDETKRRLQKLLQELE